MTDADQQPEGKSGEVVLFISLAFERSYIQTRALPNDPNMVASQVPVTPGCGRSDI